MDRRTRIIEVVRLGFVDRIPERFGYTSIFLTPTTPGVKNWLWQEGDREIEMGEEITITLSFFYGGKRTGQRLTKKILLWREGRRIYASGGEKIKDELCSVPVLSEGSGGELEIHLDRMANLQAIYSEPWRPWSPL